MKLIGILVAAFTLSACGARVLEVKTKDGGFCFMCVEKPDPVTVNKVLAPTGAK